MTNSQSAREHNKPSLTPLCRRICIALSACSTVSHADCMHVEWPALCDSQWPEASLLPSNHLKIQPPQHTGDGSAVFYSSDGRRVSCGLLWAREVVHYTARESIFDLPPGAIEPQSAAPMAGSHRMDVSVLQWLSHSQLGMLGCEIRLGWLIKSTYVW